MTLSEIIGTGIVTGYFVEIIVDHGEAYGGCVEQAIWQAEQKHVTCEVVPSPCRPNATSCGT